MQDTRKVVLPRRIINEKIISVFHQFGKFVLVSIQECDDAGNFLNIAKTVEISDDYYKELLSNSPEWAKDKPEGDFRTEDLWVLVDKIRNESGER
jgi:hypothetical protein